MRRAAYDAGMISDENSSKLVLCLEPEAACMACEEERRAPEPDAAGNQILLKTGDKFMVLDCGGGTVDITMHQVEDTNPLRLSEICEPSGGPWGSTYVDAAYERFVQQLIGDEAWRKFKPSCAWGTTVLDPFLFIYTLFCLLMPCASCNFRFFTLMQLQVSCMVAECETM